MDVARDTARAVERAYLRPHGRPRDFDGSFDGQDITAMPPHRRVELGLCQAPEGRGIFPGMTVLENLDMGAYTRRDRKTAAFRSDLDRVFEPLPRLQERRTQTGGTMSGGEQQMLAIARALMSINQQGTTVLLVEQNAQQALQRAHRAYVLETGHVVRTDEAKVLLGDESVRAAYLATGTS
jgi:branched-chain amino acid transport system ATP-binding protein